jgi:UDP-hydrolysing UDP-N-acetyl-D-glucosamine 2-epimerase
MRKIAVFTGTRAEYGLLYWIIKGIHESAVAALQLYVGGMHLSPEFGKTVGQIEKDNIPIEAKLEFLLSSDSPVGVAKSMGLALISAADVLERCKPDLLVVLGDRCEAMAMCQAAMVARIPIAHIHGGETTEGVVDEAVRHAITKMAHLHFTATEQYRKRVIQLGEHPDRVYNYGAPGIDSIKSLPLLSRAALADTLQFDIENDPYMLITYHPVTLENNGAANALAELLEALDEYPHHKFIITYPNADTFGRNLITCLQNFKKKYPGRVLLSRSLGQLRYLSALKHCELVIGNSSSGLIEAPTLHVPTINIGNRQKGRIAGESVVHCPGDKESILSALKLAHSKDFRKLCLLSRNPYGEGNSSERILSVLFERELEGLVCKTFYDCD